MDKQGAQEVLGGSQEVPGVSQAAFKGLIRPLGAL